MNDALPNRPWAPASAILLLTLAIAAAPARGQGPAPGDGERAGRLAEMQALVRTLRITDPARPAREPVPLMPEPLHRWSDPTRALSDGSLWAFGKAGRPVALVAAELYGGDAKVVPAWSCELNSLAAGPIVGEADDRFFTPAGRASPELGRPLRWAPRGLGVELTAIAGAPSPGPSAAERLRQMKALAGRVSAHQEVGGPSGSRPRYELRLLPRPVHRYADPDSGLIDGAIFLLAYGTNPELLLLIEGRKPVAGAAAWSCGFARLSTAEISASLDGREAWGRPAVEQPDPESPYYFMLTARRPKD